MPKGLYRGSIGAISGLYGVSREKFRFGVCRGLGPIFILNSKLWKGYELRRIILLQGELITFNFHFPNITIFGTGGSVHDPQKPLLLTLAPQNYFNKYKDNSQTIFAK